MLQHRFFATFMIPFWQVLMVFAPILVVILLLFFSRDEQAKTQHPALFEMYRFLMTAIIGGFVAHVFKYWEYTRQLRDERHADLKDFDRQLVEAYNDAKKIRRLLRANSRPTGTNRRAIPRDAFERLASELEEIQLRFEAMRKLAGIDRALFGREVKPVHDRLAIAESYLGRVLRVYEDGRLTESGSPDSMLVVDANILAHQALATFFFKDADFQTGTTPDSAACLQVAATQNLHGFKNTPADRRGKLFCCELPELLVGRARAGMPGGGVRAEHSPQQALGAPDVFRIFFADPVDTVREHVVLATDRG